MRTEINPVLIDEMIRHFGKEMCILKCLEEMAELNEKLIKNITKSEELKPKVSDIIEEIGDLEIRLAAVKVIFGWRAVNARIAHKQNRIGLWIEKDRQNASNNAPESTSNTRQ